MDVSDWLKGLGFPEYAEVFAQNGVDGILLAELTNEDLKDLGVARLADRRRSLKPLLTFRGKEKAVRDRFATHSLANAARSPFYLRISQTSLGYRPRLAPRRRTPFLIDTLIWSTGSSRVMAVASTSILVTT
jgi:hypothetical protein